MSDLVSTEVLKQAADGDLDAFEQVYRAYAPFVYHVALRMVNYKEDAQEIVQEVFINVHSKLKGFLFRSSLKTWVYRITTNCALNYLEKRNRYENGRVAIEDVVGSISVGPETAKNMEKHEQENKIQDLLELLNPDERACVVLRSVEGLSYEDIARSLGVNLNTVRTRLRRAREKMMAKAAEVNYE